MPGSEVLVLDVNETLSDLEPMRGRFGQAGLPGHALEAWFAATLRDGFALTAAGAYPSFRDVAGDALRSLLATQGIDEADVLGAIEHVVAGFADLPAHPDVPKKWKPHPDAYQYAAEVCGVDPARMALVAVHPWDVDGARGAGLSGIWVDRRKAPNSTAFLPPDLQVPDLEALADRLTAS